jgi:uncharacterized protein (TIGR02453 family)
MCFDQQNLFIFLLKFSLMDFANALEFLQTLSRNNNREWFERNKPRYLGIKNDFDDFLASLLNELITFDERLVNLNPKKLAFRIYRDVRFSKDKKPYKNNMGAGFSPTSKMDQEAGYYIHIQPGNKSFLAGGFYVPDPANLAKIRQEIDYNPDRLLKILNDKKFKKLFPALGNFDKLKTTPKGYPADHPHIDLLRHRSFVVSHPFTDNEVVEKKFLKQVAGVAKTLKPLNDFLTEATS